MASTNQTANFHLPQWKRTDPFRMEDFNEAFETIDEAIAATGNCSIFTGSFAGNNADNRTVALPCAPKMLIMFCRFSTTKDILLFLSPGFQKMVWDSDGKMSDAAEYFQLSGSTLLITNHLWGNTSGTTNTYVAFA